MVPAKPAISRFTTMATAMTIPIIGSSNQNQTSPPMISAKTMPFTPPTRISFSTMRMAFAGVSSFTASARTATVNVCVPALPPMEATMGMRTARATICAIVASKTEITRLARIAVNRFTKSQENRRRVVSATSE